MISRRKFLEISQVLGLSLLVPSLNTSCTARHEIKGGMSGQNAALGHRLRSMDFGPVTEIVNTDYLVVGGGVSGLSAARYLKRYSDNFLLLEMGEEVGGNARSGVNSVSRFPWGAHYLPIPDNSDPELLSFLRDCDVITGIKNGLPVYNEYYLCHDPKERLFINNFWQEGIVPHEGVPKNDREEIQRFLDLMQSFRMKTGSDGRPAFSIPIAFSSQDSQFVMLDALTADEFLASHNFSSSYLYWYVNYCCADDFGSSLKQTSAWAMIHYFAARNAKAFNASSDAVLTWPEGNFWLIEKLKKAIEDNIVRNTLVYDVKAEADGVVCSVFDAARNTSRQIKAKAVIMATPQFVNQRVLSTTQRKIDYSKFEYAPWVVANITTNYQLNERRGEGLCWDNVIFGSDSLGYVNASHQGVSVHRDKKVITYYKPLIHDDVATSRKQAYKSTFDDWRDIVVQDLAKPHPDLIKHADEMNVWIWGHGMIRPAKDFIWSRNRRDAQQTIDNRIFFAHSDLSGISIFEEAFYQGHQAAKMVLAL